VESADIKLEDEPEKQKDKDYLKDVENFIGYLKTIYGEKVADVRLSQRLVESSCILVHADDGPSLQMEKIMKMVNKDYAYSKKIFEINPGNPLINELVRIHKKQPDSADLKSLSEQLLDNMLLREGVIDQIDTIVPRIQDIMHQAAKGL
jgi:molecular chaperone HtpG